jgi:hypothetical protein
MPTYRPIADPNPWGSSFTGSPENSTGMRWTNVDDDPDGPDLSNSLAWTGSSGGEELVLNFEPLPGLPSALAVRLYAGATSAEFSINQIAVLCGTANYIGLADPDVPLTATDGLYEIEPIINPQNLGSGNFDFDICQVLVRFGKALGSPHTLSLYAIEIVADGNYGGGPGPGGQDGRQGSFHLQLCGA